MARLPDVAGRGALLAIPGYFGRLLEPEDGRALQALLERCADYFELTCGVPPGPAEAQSTFTVLPEGKGYDDKFLIGIFKGSGQGGSGQNDSSHKHSGEKGCGELVGVLDVIRDHPHPAEWCLGLMLLDPCERGRGLGEHLYQAFECWVAEQGGCSVRLGVVEQNERAHRFWLRMGFEPISRKPAQKFGVRESTVIVMRHMLRAASTSGTDS